MKKILFLAAFALVGMSANAQLVTTTSRSIKVEKTPSNTIWLIRGGLTFAGVSGSDLTGSKSRTGFNVGVEFQKPISDGFYWGAGLGLKSKGCKSNDDDSKVSLTALEIPINVGYKVDLAQDFKLDIHAGGFANLDLFGNAEYTDYTYNPYSGSYGGYSIKTYDISLGDFDDAFGGYSRFGGGLAAGVGLWYQQFNINLNFQWGLFEQFDKLNVKESNVMLSLGYAF